MSENEHLWTNQEAGNIYKEEMNTEYQIALSPGPLK